MSTINFEQCKGIQRRTFPASVRTMAGDEFALVGYAAMFDNWSKNLGGFVERVAPGAFVRSLRAQADVKALFNHQPDNILGRTKSGTLVLTQDEKGLRFRVQLNRNSQQHRDLYESVQRGDIDECSFAFTVPSGGDDWADGSDPETGESCAMRTLKDVDLLDVSVVTYPAYNATSVGARAGGKKTAPVIPSAPTEYVIEMFQKAQRALAKARILEAKRESPLTGNAPYDYDTLTRHMDLAAEFMEAAFAMSSTANDMLQPGGPFDDEEDDSMRNYKAHKKAFREAHTKSHVSMDLACKNLASTRFMLTRLLKSASQIAS